MKFHAWNSWGLKPQEKFLAQQKELRNMAQDIKILEVYLVFQTNKN